MERGKKILRFAAPAFLLLLLTLAAHMLMRPQKRPVRIGVDSPSPALGVEIFKNFDSAVEIVPLAQAAGLATGLAPGAAHADGMAMVRHSQRERNFFRVFISAAPHLLYGYAILGKFGKIWMMLVGALAVITKTSASLQSV